MITNEDMKDQKETEQLLSWYDARRRILPWREEPTPYHVWLSEIMLQQTRVEAVREHYARFLREIPDIHALASADEDCYLKLWEGLGYYSRIRNMHKAAVEIEERCGGEMPKTAEELVRLPGIGEYTAAAIASIAFGQPVPSVDGNLLRVWARKTASADNIKAPATVKSARTYYAERISRTRPGDYNQALMDLGATVCLPKGQPDCDLCPWNRCCSAHLDGRELDFPVVPAKASRRVEKRTVFIIHDSSRVLLHRRGDKGLLAGLWEFPGTEGVLTKSSAVRFLQEHGLKPTEIRKLPPAKHVFSHVEWRMTGYDVFADGLPALPLPEDYAAASRTDLEEIYTVPSAFAAFLNSEAIRSLL